MQHGLIFLVGDHAQNILFGIRWIIQQGKGLVAVRGNDHLVEFFRRLVLRLNFNMVRMPSHRCDGTVDPDPIGIGLGYWFDVLPRPPLDREPLRLVFDV